MVMWKWTLVTLAAFFTLMLLSQPWTAEAKVNSPAGQPLVDHASAALPLTVETLSEEILDAGDSILIPLERVERAFKGIAACTSNRAIRDISLSAAEASAKRDAEGLREAAFRLAKILTADEKVRDIVRCRSSDILIALLASYSPIINGYLVASKGFVSYDRLGPGALPPGLPLSKHFTLLREVLRSYFGTRTMPISIGGKMQQILLHWNIYVYEDHLVYDPHNLNTIPLLLGLMGTIDEEYWLLYTKLLDRENLIHLYLVVPLDTAYPPAAQAALFKLVKGYAPRGPPAVIDAAAEALRRGDVATHMLLSSMLDSAYRDYVIQLASTPVFRAFLENPLTKPITQANSFTRLGRISLARSIVLKLNLLRPRLATVSSVDLAIFTDYRGIIITSPTALSATLRAYKWLPAPSSLIREYQTPACRLYAILASSANTQKEWSMAADAAIACLAETGSAKTLIDLMMRQPLAIPRPSLVEEVLADIDRGKIRVEPVDLGIGIWTLRIDPNKVKSTLEKMLEGGRWASARGLAIDPAINLYDIALQKLVDKPYLSIVYATYVNYMLDARAVPVPAEFRESLGELVNAYYEGGPRAILAASKRLADAIEKHYTKISSILHDNTLKTAIAIVASLTRHGDNIIVDENRALRLAALLNNARLLEEREQESPAIRQEQATTKTSIIQATEKEEKVEEKKLARPLIERSKETGEKASNNTKATPEKVSAIAKQYIAETEHEEAPRSESVTYTPRLTPENKNTMENLPRENKGGSKAPRETRITYTYTPTYTVTYTTIPYTRHYTKTPEPHGKELSKTLRALAKKLKNNGLERIASLLKREAEALERGDTLAASEAARQLARSLNNNPELAERISRELGPQNLKDLLRALGLEAKSIKHTTSSTERSERATKHAKHAAPRSTMPPRAEKTTREISDLAGLARAIKAESRSFYTIMGRTMSKLSKTYQAGKQTDRISEYVMHLPSGNLESHIPKALSRLAEHPHLDVKMSPMHISLHDFTPKSRVSNGAIILLLMVITLGVLMGLTRHTRDLRRITATIEKRMLQSKINRVKETGEKKGGLEDLVIDLYKNLLNIYAKLYREKRPSETHREYGYALPEHEKNTYGPAAKIYEKAKFSSKRVTRKDIEALISAISSASTRAEKGRQGLHASEL